MTLAAIGAEFFNGIKTQPHLRNAQDLHEKSAIRRLIPVGPVMSCAGAALLGATPGATKIALSMRTALVASVIFICAYLLGSIPFGLLVSRARGIDIREHGSRNIGATNVWRVLGRTWGLTTFICDVAKGWLAVVVGFAIAHFTGVFRDPAFAGIIAALGCITGHNFPVWLRFKGGKGVATSLGVIIGMMPLASVIVFAIWLVVLRISRYVSLASIVAAVSLPVVVIALLFTNLLHGWGNFYFACAAALLVVRRHRENIKRLMAGTENRFGPRESDEHSPAARQGEPTSTEKQNG